MLPLKSPDPDFSTNIMEKESPVGMLFFAEQLRNGQETIQTFGSFVWIIDFVLDEIIEIDGRRLPAGVWQVTKCVSRERKITGAGTNKGYFFSIALRENPYTLIQNGTQKGLFCASMAYPILKLISRMTERDDHRSNHIWIESYVHLLLTQLNIKGSNRAAAIFGELKIIFGIIERLNKSTNRFPDPAELVRESGIKVYRFQKGCLALYGRSAKKIIQHLKMKTAFEAILIHRKSIMRTSAALGFHHTPNFITAFRKHFGITPAEAGHFYFPSLF